MYTNIFHCKTFQNLRKLGLFSLKIFHLATLVLEPGESGMAAGLPDGSRGKKYQKQN
jgi:hypothetical protein